MRTLLLTLLLVLVPLLPALAQAQEKPEHEVLGLIYHPYAAMTLSRISDDATWSTGAVLGAEIDAGGGFVGVSYRLHDILTDDESEVIPWDGTFELALGIYF